MAIDRIEAHDRLALTGLHAHIGSQLLALQPFRLAVAAMASLGHFATVNLGGGLGVAYHRAEEAPRIADYARAKVDAVHEHFGTDVTIMDEPGRALVGQRLRDALHRRSRSSATSRRGSASTAACRTTCGRCSTARATRPRSPTASAAARTATSSASTASPAT